MQPTHQIPHNALGNFPHQINGRIVCCTKQPPRYLFTVNKKPKTSHLRFPPTDSKSQLSHGQGHQEPRPGFNPPPAPATLPLSRVGRYLIDWHSTLILSRGSHLGIGVPADENQTICMHPVCICPWHWCNDVTMAVGFDLLPLGFGRGRACDGAGLASVWFLLEGHSRRRKLHL